MVVTMQCEWVSRVLRPTRHIIGHFRDGLHHLTVTDKQTIRKILNINHKKNTHKHNRNKRKKQLNIQQKQNYPGSVASYDSWPGKEVGLFYNGPERHTGQAHGTYNYLLVMKLHHLPTTDISSVHDADCCKQRTTDVIMPAFEHCIAFQLDVVHSWQMDSDTRRCWSTDDMSTSQSISITAAALFCTRQLRWYSAMSNSLPEFTSMSSINNCESLSWSRSTT